MLLLKYPNFLLLVAAIIAIWIIIPRADHFSREILVRGTSRTNFSVTVLLWHKSSQVYSKYKSTYVCVYAHARPATARVHYYLLAESNPMCIMRAEGRGGR